MDTSNVSTNCLLSGHANLDEIKSRIKDIEDGAIQFRVSSGLSGVSSLESGQHMKDWLLELENNVTRIVEECSDLSSLGNEDLDAYLKHLIHELHENESECAKVSLEVDLLSKEHLSDYVQFDRNLEGLKCVFEHMQSKIFDEESHEDPENNGWVCEDNNLEELRANYSDGTKEITNRMGQNDEFPKSLPNVDNLLQRVDGIKEIEDLFSSIEVIDIDGTNIHLSLTTHVQETIDQAIETSEVHHELLITVDGGSMELSNAKIFPDDVYIDEIVLASKSFRQSVPQLTISRIRTSVEWFVGKVQDKIVQCFLRQLAVRKFNRTSRYSFQYMDKEECITVPLARQIVASIKVSHCWPMGSGSLMLISLKKKSQHLEEELSSLLHIVQESMSSLDGKTCHDLPSFVEAIEGSLKQNC